VNAIRILASNRQWLASFRWVASASLFVAFLGVATGDTRPDFGDREDEFRRRSRATFEAAREHYRSDTNSPVAAWEFARAAYDLAEFARTKTEREKLATQGVAACRRAVFLAPKSAPAHYYLGMNLGQLARVYLLKGLRIVSQMEEAFLAARGLDPMFDYAGADRALGLLYHQAPGWPISLGNRSKASRHLTEAVRLQPDYPGNHIALAGFLHDTRQLRLFATQWEALKELLPHARTEFAGTDWELSWFEWNHRLNQILAQSAPNPE
jgi:tetratricopeptide (TPR) repeat protein